MARIGPPCLGRSCGVSLNTKITFHRANIVPTSEKAASSNHTLIVTVVTFDLVRARLSGRTPLRISEPGTIQAAVALLLAPGESGELEVLLIKRSEHPEDPWSGQMALPGGRREARDRDLVETAARETREETGLGVDRGLLLGELDDLHPRTPVLPPVVVRPFVFGLPKQPPIELSGEVALHIWVPIESLPGTASRARITVAGGQREVSGYRIGPHLVWGMTEGILTPFLELVLQDRASA